MRNHHTLQVQACGAGWSNGSLSRAWFPSFEAFLPTLRSRTHSSPAGPCHPGRQRQLAAGGLWESCKVASSRRRLFALHKCCLSPPSSSSRPSILLSGPEIQKSHDAVVQVCRETSQPASQPSASSSVLTIHAVLPVTGNQLPPSRGVRSALFPVQHLI